MSGEPSDLLAAAAEGCAAAYFSVKIGGSDLFVVVIVVSSSKQSQNATIPICYPILIIAHIFYGGKFGFG